MITFFSIIATFLFIRKVASPHVQGCFATRTDQGNLTLFIAFFLYNNNDKGGGNALSSTVKSFSILEFPKFFPLFFIFNRVIPIAERYIEILPAIALASQNLLNANIRDHIQVTLLVNKSDNAIVIRILHLLVFRFKGLEVNNLIAAELRPVNLHFVFNSYGPFFDFANIHDFLSAPLGLDFLRSPFYFI